MHDRFERRITEGLEKLAAACQKRAHSPVAIAQRVGRLLGQNSRAAKLFEVDVGTDRARGRDRAVDDVSGVARLVPAQRRVLRAAQ